MKPFTVGDRAGQTALNNRYWRGAAHELFLLGHVRLADKPETKPRAYLVVFPLPNKGALGKLIKEQLYTKPLRDWMEEAKGDEDCLKEEMGEWRDNMDSGGLDQTPKYDEVSQAADALDSQKIPEDIPAHLRAIPVYVDPMALVISAPHRHKKRRSGRSWRHDENVAILEAIRDAVDEWVCERSPVLDPDNKRHAAHASKVEAAEDFHKELEDYIGEVECVEFPGMF